MIVLELPMGRSSRFRRKSASRFWSDVANCHWATGPLTSVTVLFAKLAKGQYGRSVLVQLHSDETVKIMHINLRFFIRLDLP